jgi:thymidylate kinase
MRRRPGPGLLIALSGMDGAGKSSAAALIEERLRAAGHGVKQEWHRLGEMDTLDRLAGPVKRVVRLPRPVRGSIVHGSAPLRGPVGWSWVTMVSIETARGHLLSSGLTRSGTSVVADRWVTDSLVDLEVRYGRHALAERILTGFAPRADLDILLEIDAATSAQRKPGDWPLPVLERMEAAYARAAAVTGARRIDATRPQDDVLAELVTLVDGAIARAAA